MTSFTPVILLNSHISIYGFYEMYFYLWKSKKKKKTCLTEFVIEVYQHFSS